MRLLLEVGPDIPAPFYRILINYLISLAIAVYRVIFSLKLVGSKGIGRAVVDILAESGCNVSLCARNAEEVAEAVKELQAANPGVKFHGQAVDMGSSPEVIKAYVDAAAAALGGLDIVISNAAALAVGGSKEAFEANFKVDLLGAVNLATVVVPHLKKSRAPSFTAISSVAARNSDDLNSYGVVKAALNHAIKGLGSRYAKIGIRFNRCVGSVKCKYSSVSSHRLSHSNSFELPWTFTSYNSLSPGTTIFPGGVWERSRC